MGELSNTYSQTETAVQTFEFWQNVYRVVFGGTEEANPG